MSETYRIETFNDMLKVPSDQRAAMFRDLETALELHQFAFGEEAERTPISAISWTDDGDASVSMTDAAGNPVLTLEITRKETP